MDVRLALPTDLASVQSVEDASDRVFATVMDVSSWGGSPTGQERVDELGFLLVAVDGDGVVGFAHVLDLDGNAHLEQLSVLPDRSRQGIGAALLEQACRYAAEQGFVQVTLRTFRDVPWNAPWADGAASCTDRPATADRRAIRAGSGRDRPFPVAEPVCVGGGSAATVAIDRHPLTTCPVRQGRRS